MPNRPDDLEVVVDARARIGESPTWSSEEQALYWMDVKAPALHRFDPATGETRSWPVTSDLGAFALMEGGAALVALREGVFRLDLATGTLKLLAPPPFDPALFRFNEGGCDPTGRFWVGVMFDPLEGSPAARPGSLHSFTVESGLRPEPDSAELHNGMAWSGDGTAFFLSHSNSGVIYRFDFDPRAGCLGERHLFAEVPASDGVPDGAAVDAKGGYWCALHGGSRIRRYRADGSIDRDFELPVSQPTMCAFAGKALDMLYVTTAAEKLSAAERQAQPHAGALFRFKPGAVGVERRFTIAGGSPIAR